MTVEAMDTDVGETGKGSTNDFSSYGVQDMMKLYYGRLFPYDDFYRWLAYGNESKHPQADGSYMQRREFCFTLDGDIFVRYQSFKDTSALQQAIKERCPSKIDIGAVYNINPARRAAYAGTGQTFLPVERELVFDVDLTDYDDVRTCGQGGHICRKCWPLMAAAIQILDRGLREDFGFKHILYVYSGRRGVHAWVCDERARRLTDEQRASVANYFAIYRGQEKGLAKLVLGAEEHPAVSRAAELLLPVFLERLLPEQELLGSADRREAVLGYLLSQGESVAARIRSRWDRMVCSNDSLALWRVLEDEVGDEVAARQKSRDFKGARALERAVRAIVFAHAYPRLDLEVSKKMNHLLKAPFCVHPKTGRVCVPIAPAEAAAFDPETVPTVAELLAQLNNSTTQEGGADWASTALAPAMGVFRNCFLDGLVATTKETLAEKARQAGAAPTLAW